MGIKPTGDSEGETLFLRNLLLACGTAESRKLDEKLCEAFRHERCVRRSIWWALQFIFIALAGLGYTAVLLRDIPEEVFELLITFFSRIAFGAAIGLMGFLAFWGIYRKQLGQLRTECRNFITRLLHSCLDSPGLLFFPQRMPELIRYPIQQQLEDEKRKLLAKSS